MIRPAETPPAADMETLSPEDQAMLDRVLARRGPRPLMLTPEDPPSAVWIALAITFAGVVGLVMAVILIAVQL